MTLLVAAAGLAAMVAAHELGHLLAARILGVRIEEFVLGRGPALLNARVGGASVSVHLLFFLGGHVRMAGMLDERVPGSLASQSPRRRALIVAAGPSVNILLALSVLLCGHVATGASFANSFGTAGGDAIRIVAGLGEAAVGLVTGDADGFSGAVQGVLRMVEGLGISASGTLGYYLGLVALLGLYLGLFNLLPVPPLDGGRLVLIAVEKACGRAMDQHIFGGLAFAGMASLAVLALFLGYEDLGRLISWLSGR